MNYRENYVQLEERISLACSRCGRKREEVRLIAVSKTKPASAVLEIYDCGQRLFGENRVQELEEKRKDCPEDIRWHLIGHLQTNKVKNVVGRVSLIHSVDSLHLAEEISKEAGKRNLVQEILLEVNMAGEASKFGIDPENCVEVAAKIAALPNMKIKGLMTVAPNVEDPEENRMVFRKLKQLSVDINSKKFDNTEMNELSMGMTNDFETAIEEGATFIRVGSAIFGERNYL